MHRTATDIARPCSVLILLLFVAALFAPATEITEAGHHLLRRVQTYPGYRIAAFGWLGPLELTFAWYANIPLIVAAIALVRQRVPSARLAVVAFCLALSALLPHVIYSEVDGWHIGYYRGPALWLWLTAFPVNPAATFYLRRAEPAQFKP